MAFSKSERASAMAFGKLLDKAKQVAAEVNDKAGDPSGKVGEAVLAVVKDLNDALPHLAKAGYTMNELEIEVGILPKLIPHFTVNEISGENIEQSSKDLEENTVGYALFTALRKATDLQQKLIIDGMSFARIEIELGLTPVVRLSYKPM